MRAILSCKSTKLEEAGFRCDRRHGVLRCRKEERSPCVVEALLENSLRRRVASDALECALKRAHTDTHGFRNFLNAQGFSCVGSDPLLGPAHLVLTNFCGDCHVVRRHLHQAFDKGCEQHLFCVKARLSLHGEW